MSNLKNIFIGKIYSSNNSGDFKVTDVKNNTCVEIEFVNTGYRKIVQACKIRTGSIKDPYNPIIYGLGFYGEGEYKSHIDGKTSIEYSRWYSIFERCYDPRVHAKTPRYKDCSVHPYWYNFQNFAKWFNENKPDVEDMSVYDIDKDIKFKGNRIYSPKNCIIVHSSINQSYSNENKKLLFIKSPSNIVYPLTNVTRFAKEFGLQATLLWKVIKGERKHHRGWKTPV